MEHLPAANVLVGAACFNSDTLLLESGDLNEVRECVGSVFKPHKLALPGASHQLPSRMYHARHGSLSLNLLHYDGDVTIDPERLDSFFLLQIPVSGGAEIECGGRRFDSSPTVASLVSPTLPLRMRWIRCPQVVLRIEREAIERHCSRHFGTEERGAVEFEPAFELASPSGMCLLPLLSVLGNALSDPAHPLRHPLAYEQFESTLLNALVYGQPNTARSGARPSRGPLAPFYVKRVEEYVRLHVHEPLTIERLAEFAGVSASTLFSGFRNCHGVSPMAWVRQLRLERVRDELRGAAAEPVSVTDVALKWGFAHLGRFAMEYKRMFGESPSVSLRNRSG
ncbi:AraC family transcriptional regulator [Paraburkholderia diazotrophica]|uniref:Transcriptional regulator, AraC family n=1 Tax=Paraburkholderia diazotrophica TaxID=667676 RepID=A0A1H7EJ68_9BURK|nr:AraC family transcriptional regulator [Paraburkholderia diazotrophica]SEK13644.1 transcriptional regulator, AraC family [Paraburkholderia diazotrophica]